MIASSRNPVVPEIKDTYSVSVIIPTLNGGERFKEVLSSLAGQTCVPDEILVIDSASGDNTLATARKFNARIQSIARAEFDHGGTRTLGGRMASGDILVYMTQDAVLSDSGALEELVTSFSDPRVAAAYGRQVPDRDATSFARHLRLFNYPEKSVVRCWEDRERYGFKTAFISNSFAAYRKELLESAGFFQSGLLFGEDTFTIAKLLRKGYCVAYAADAKVAHSHNYTVFQEFRRYFDIGVFHADNRALLESFGTPIGEGKRYVRSEFSQLMREKEFFRLSESVVRNMSKLLAYNLGKRYSCLPRRFAVFCSFNRGWWG
jgi:rhamnosyltransferase